jgi:tRNA pseudouridine55 synthase
MHGALLVDKPSGPTSHDIVAIARRALKTRAVGHTGTLDPLATGLLVLLVGHATRLAQFLVTDEKEYLADVRLGQSTPTYDAQGLGSDRGQTGVRPGFDPGLTPSPERVAAVLAAFVGTFPQVPPPFSAKKVGGERAYKKARRHEPVALKPVEVTVRELEVVPADPRSSDPTLLRLRIVCSAGFYVRSLAHDLGQLLGCGAHLEALRRTRAGQFSVGDAVSLAVLHEAAGGDALVQRLVNPNTLLGAMPSVTPTDEGLRRAWNGNTLGPGHLQAPLASPAGTAKVRVLGHSGEVLAVAERRSDGLLHPLVVLR